MVPVPSVCNAIGAVAQASTYADDPDNASSHYGAHHGPEADLLLGVNAPEFWHSVSKLLLHAVAVLPGEDHTNACVNCHMAGPLADAEGEINRCWRTFMEYE